MNNEPRTLGNSRVEYPCYSYIHGLKSMTKLNLFQLVNKSIDTTYSFARPPWRIVATEDCKLVRLLPLKLRSSCFTRVILNTD